MASGFITIPDWFSFENQGAGIALADLTGAGARDLIVLMVDNPPAKPGSVPGRKKPRRRWDSHGRMDRLDGDT